MKDEQLDGNALSAFSVEDLPSNWMGVLFGVSAGKATAAVSLLGKNPGELLGITPEDIAKGDIRAALSKLPGSLKGDDGRQRGLIDFTSRFYRFLEDNEAFVYSGDSIEQRQQKKILQQGAEEMKKRKNFTKKPEFMKPEFHDTLFPKTKAGSKAPVAP